MVRLCATNSEDASEVAASAEELFRMTSFKSAVAIDTPDAMTDYDRSVFGAGAGAGDAVTPPAGNSTADVSFSTGDAHVDGRRYLMGDGFMLDEDFADGSVRTRRVAVMHSRSCLDNRTIIGNVPGVFEALVTAIRSAISLCGRQRGRGRKRRAESKLLDSV